MKTFLLAVLAICNPIFAQNQIPAPGLVQTTGKAINATALASATTIATCPSSATNFCTYLVGIQLECNAANPDTGVGSLSGNLTFSDDVTSGYGIQLAALNVATCSAFVSGVVTASWLPRFIIAKPGSSIQYSVTGSITGTYNYDLAWAVVRLS